MMAVEQHDHIPTAPHACRLMCVWGEEGSPQPPTEMPTRIFHSRPLTCPFPAAVGQLQGAWPAV